MQEFKGKLGAGKDICKHIDYKAVVKTTVGEQKIAAVEKILAAMDSPILARHVGGTAPDQVRQQVAAWQTRLARG
jgi:chemotaxis receptor (MCP) glutamine deamidase CheD